MLTSFETRMIIFLLDTRSRINFSSTCKRLLELAHCEVLRFGAPVSGDPELTEDHVGRALAREPVYVSSYCHNFSPQIVDRIVTCSSIRHLDLRNVHLHENSIALLCSNLVGNKYESLTLCATGFTTNTVRSFADNLIACKSLSLLCLAGNRLTNYGATTITWAIAQNKHKRMKALSLHDTGMDWDSVLRLISVLERTKNLIELDVSKNCLGDVGIRAFGSWLGRGCVLQMLNLSAAMVDDGAAAALSEGLQANNKLTWLKLSHNLISPSGAACIGKNSHRAYACTPILLKVGISYSQLLNHMQLQRCYAIVRSSLYR